ncbi:PAS domain S-box protein [Silanimonas sp.]|jgi:methyl-accepting chemotaxis protein|uniref:PAS domain S-box protein n=1 Tax=Silanimonas sp. TaxID=1929290 RepID=UPI0037CABBFD
MSLGKPHDWPHRLLDTLGHPDPKVQQLEATVAAMRRSSAVIEFTPDGTILDANDLFLDALGYRLDEIRGQHHRMFLKPEEATSPAYKDFWSGLASGRFSTGQYQRRHKCGTAVWIQASYNPVLDAQGRTAKVVKFATDITAQRLAEAEAKAKLDAIDRAMAMIEFDLDGRILYANAAFLAATGYALAEIVGQHHRLFVAPADVSSSSYAAFWARLREGHADQGQYRRFGKGGREVWLEATYNPVKDPSGRPFKVVKFATDITAQKRQDVEFGNQMAAVDRAQAIIEFDLDGTILKANANFLSATGYRLDEIVGQHHRMFLRPAERDGAAYRDFWPSLARGEAKVGRFRRVGRGGRSLWLEASYNVLSGPDGKPYKVVKFATDITPAINDMMGEIKAFSMLIHAASSEIATGNEDLAKRTEAQAANLEETAAAMEELTSTVKANAAAATEARQRAIAVANEANGADHVVHDVMGSMAEIETSSRKIADIIGLIDGIAFQTNILALNAAVEAARAGEQGRGFAVVATEVRALAQRSAVAAKEIKGLIEKANTSVHEGANRARHAGEVMAGIVRQVQTVSALMQDIASATTEQASGIEQVGITVMQMDKATQQNAALVEEAAAAARSLDDQVDGLLSIVRSYVD